MTIQAIKRKIAHIKSLVISEIQKEIDDYAPIYGDSSSYIKSCKSELKNAKNKDKIIKKLEAKLNVLYV
jgi:hypothetical protein